MTYKRKRVYTCMLCGKDGIGATAYEDGIIPTHELPFMWTGQKGRRGACFCYECSQAMRKTADAIAKTIRKAKSLPDCEVDE